MDKDDRILLIVTIVIMTISNILTFIVNLKE